MYYIIGVDESLGGAAVVDWMDTELTAALDFRAMVPPTPLFDLQHAILKTDSMSLQERRDQTVAGA